MDHLCLRHTAFHLVVLSARHGLTEADGFILSTSSTFLNHDVQRHLCLPYKQCDSCLAKNYLVMYSVSINISASNGTTGLPTLVWPKP
jgi:hypothetical protein